MGGLKLQLVESETSNEETQGQLEEKISIGRTKVGNTCVWPTFIDKSVIQALANDNPRQHLIILQSKPRQSATISKCTKFLLRVIFGSAEEN